MSLNTILQYDFTTPGLDLSPSNLNGSYANGCLWNQPGASISLKSASFNGNGQYIQVPQFTTPTNGITFSFWFRSVNSATWGRIFDFGNGPSSDNIIAYINNGNLGLCVYKNTNGDRTQYDNVLGYNINFGNWIYIAWVLNTNNSWTLYVNGSIVQNPGSNPGAGYYPISKARNNNYLGKSNWNDPYFNGNICDFRMFDGILTQDNIRNIYNTNTTNYLNYVRYKPSINNAISLTAGTVMCKWSDLNIASNSNMGFSFTITIQSITPQWRNILHITNNQDCCNYGERTPGIWITAGKSSIYICVDGTNKPNNCIETSQLTLGIEYKIVVSWYVNTVYFYCIDKTKNLSFYIGSILNPSSNSNVYLSDTTFNNPSAYTTGGFKIKDIIFYNNTLNQWDANNIFATTPTPIIPWKYAPSIGNFIKTFQSNYVTRWSNLNVNNSLVMSISFFIKLTNLNASWRNIFHITNTNNNCCNSGDRLPGVWITPNDTALHLAFCDVSNTNIGFVTNSKIKLNTSTKIDIIININTVYVYFNSILVTIYTIPNNIVQANDNAYFYLADPWHPSVDMYISDFTIYNGISINPPTSNDNYQYIGCYNDTDSRAIPNYVGNVTSIDQCKEFAISNKATTYSVQYNGQCFIGTDINSAVQYGKTNGCPPLGGAWTNQVYSVNAPTYTLWSSLNITDSKNMSLSFNINIGKTNDNLRGIVHVSISGYNVSNLGDRVPAIYVTPKASSLAIANDTNSPTGFFTGNLPLNTDINVVIVWVGGTKVYVYFNNKLNTIYNYTQIPIQPNKDAIVYSPDPWARMVDMTVTGLSFTNGAAINPPTSTQTFKYIGCFNDSTNTSTPAIPNNVGKVINTDDCKEYAIANNGTVYGIGDGTCFWGTDIDSAIQYGPTTDCSPLGNPLKNQIYSINSPSYLFWSSNGIIDSTNMTLSFTINIQNTNSNIRSIVQVSNTNNKSGSSGDIVPGVFITKSALSLTIINDINTAPNSSFTTNILPAKTDINVVIVWIGKKVYVYFNNNLVNINTFSQPLIPAIPNARVYIGHNNWYPTSVDYTIKDIKFSNGALIKPPTSTNVYSNIGCYNDNSAKRAIPNYMGTVSSVNDCQEYAISKNSPLFGVQNSSENGADCYLGNNINDALQYGEANNCPSMGGPLTNQIYSTQGIPEQTFEYVGCYKDVNTDALPDKLGNVRNPYDCEVLAKTKAYTTYGLQNSGICYGGNDINGARKYGLQTDSSKCTKLGGEKTNQLYNITKPSPMSNMSANMPSSVNKYTYQGCYNNNDNTAIPTIIKKQVASVGVCSDIALSKQYNTFGVSNGVCYGSNNLAEAKIQGENNASYYCGTLGSDSTYQIYFRDENLAPFSPESPGNLSSINFAERFSNYNTDNNTKFKLFKLLIMIIFIIILIYLIYCI